MMSFQLAYLNYLLAWRLAFKLEAGTGSTFPTCEVTEVEYLSFDHFALRSKSDLITSRKDSNISDSLCGICR